MRYETYRQVEPDELVAIAHRSLIAVIDMVDHLCALMELHNIEDKVTCKTHSYTHEKIGLRKDLIKRD